MTVITKMNYEEIVRGEPLERVVTQPAIDMTGSFWTLGDWRPQFPSFVAFPTLGLQRMVKQIREWTGWSTRRTAEVLNTTHTTLRAVENGRPLVSGHSGDLRERLISMHDVVERVHLLVNRDSDRTAEVLDSAPPGQLSPSDELQAGNPARSYLAAIDVLRPRRPGLLVGDRLRREGATASLHE
jgi:hypothetical protein